MWSLGKLVIYFYKLGIPHSQEKTVRVSGNRPKRKTENNKNDLLLSAHQIYCLPDVNRAIDRNPGVNISQLRNTSEHSPIVWIHIFGVILKSPYVVIFQRFVGTGQARLENKLLVFLGPGTCKIFQSYNNKLYLTCQIQEDKEFHFHSWQTPLAWDIQTTADYPMKMSTFYNQILLTSAYLLRRTCQTSFIKTWLKRNKNGLKCSLMA